MFQPPFCPHRNCPAHLAPPPDFCTRHGSFRAQCRAHPVPRFRCRHCCRTFSRQTFRVDYRDHRPDLNTRLLVRLASGLGLRESSRQLGLSLRCVELKARKLARHLRQLNVRLAPRLSSGRRLVFDELETYECRRNTRPLTLPILVDAESRFLLWAESAPIRPSGTMTKARRKAIAEDKARFGPRKDLSKRACRRTLERVAKMVPEGAVVDFDTDEKKTYPGLIRAVFGEKLRSHRTTKSILPRHTWNPLFPVNHEEARARDLMGRLRRESWLVSKKRRYLDLALQLHLAFRNFVRRRTNKDDRSPAMCLGLIHRRLRPTELLSWRQVWGDRSPMPIGRTLRAEVEAA